MTLSGMRVQRLRFALTSIAASAALVSSVHAQLPRFNFAKPDWTSTESYSAVEGLRELSNGNVIVADFGEVAVHLLGADGRLISPIGRKGPGPAEFLHPNTLIALPNDTTLIVDRDARKFLLVDGRGKIVGSHPFPVELADGADFIRAADRSGRLYFRGGLNSGKGGAANTAAIARWKRGANIIDTLATIDLLVSGGMLIDPKVLPKGSKLIGRTIVRFGAVDDWASGSTGRVAIIRATPYRVDWVETDRSMTRGVALPYQPVPVTEADRKKTEPKGPPYVRTYAKVKSPFITETAIVDGDDNVWVARHEPSASTTRRWDIFDASGRHSGMITLPIDRTLIGVTKRFAYLRHVDADGLQWIERYSAAVSTNTRK